MLLLLVILLILLLLLLGTIVVLLVLVIILLILIVVIVLLILLVCILLLVLILLHAIVPCHVHPLGGRRILRTIAVIVLFAASVICGRTNIIICKSGVHYHIVSFWVQTRFLLIIVSGCTSTSNVVRWIAPLYGLLLLHLLWLLFNVLLLLIVLVLLHLNLILRLLLETSIIEAKLLIIALGCCRWHAKCITELIVLILGWLRLLLYRVIIGEKVHVALLRRRIALECRT